MNIITNSESFSIIPPTPIDANVTILESLLYDYLGAIVCHMHIDKGVLLSALDRTNSDFTKLSAWINTLPALEKRQVLYGLVKNAYGLLNAHILSMTGSEYNAMDAHLKKLGLNGWKCFDAIDIYVDLGIIDNKTTLITDKRFDNKFADPFIEHFRKCAQRVLPTK